MSAWLQSKITIKSGPRYRWDHNRNRSVLRSGWNPFAGLRVSLIDESLSKERVSIYIEPMAPGTSMLFFMFFTPMLVMLPVLGPLAISNAQARGYFFFKNEVTGKIDLFHRIKPFYGEEIRNTYEDVTYFGIKFTRDISFENLYTSSFVLTFKDGQIKIPNGECFVLSHHVELDFLMDAVNGLIARSMESRDDLNSIVFPMLSTGRADEHAAIPFAASCMVERRGLPDGFADCIFNAEEVEERTGISGPIDETSPFPEDFHRIPMRTADAGRRVDTSSNVRVDASGMRIDAAGRIIESSDTASTSTSTSSSHAAVDCPIQEAMLIPDPVYRQPHAPSDFPNIPY